MINTTHPNFAIDDVQFRASNALPRTTFEQIGRWRAFDGTLNVQKWGFDPKQEMVFEFDLLTGEEFEALKEMVNTGFHEIVSNIEGASFAFTGYLEFFDYSEAFAGTKKSIKVKVFEK